ncbi:S9 family peptidase [Haloferula chungangensis]|uniref:S9 family peptidase n=1 Tax=Haloferula chungangensis TaxID=1048331 RepID=A0ABW2L9M5_9BACT
MISTPRFKPRRYHFAASLMITLRLSAAPVEMTPVDFLSLADVSKGELSPDGKSLLYLQRETDWALNKSVTKLWRKSLAREEARAMTHGPDSVREPAWAPDGALISFVSKRPGDAVAQIYLMHADGGEAFRLGKLDDEPSQLKWSPDGRVIYYLAKKSLPKDERKGLEKKTLIPLFEDQRRQSLLWKIDVVSGENMRVSPEDRSVVRFSIAPGGNELVVVLAPGPLLDQLPEAELWTMNLDGAESRQWTENEHLELMPRVSPDGDRLAYLASVDRQGGSYCNSNLFILDRLSGETTEVAEDFPGEILAYAWGGEEGGIYFIGNTGLTAQLYFHDPESGGTRQLTEGDQTTTEWSYDPELGVHLLGIQSAVERGDLWSLKRGDRELSRLTDVHEDLGSRFLLPKQEKIEWQGEDGVTVEGLLVYPLNYTKGERFPLVVQTHGGPRKSDKFGSWKSGHYLPVVAAQGYGVLMPNYRGSTGYGDPFLQDMVGGYFRNSHLDVLRGVDHLIEAGLADPDKLVKKGWSAGGHMTNKIITVTDRFKAASSGAGAVDWVSQFGETDVSYGRIPWFGGTPWQENAPTRSYQDTSVVSQLWKVTTPTLIFVGENDRRVPASQSKILFRGLRDQGVTTELYVAPGEAHGWRRPSHQLFRINKELEWFARHVHGVDYEYQTAPEK